VVIRDREESRGLEASQAHEGRMGRKGWWGKLSFLRDGPFFVFEPGNLLGLSGLIAAAAFSRGRRGGFERKPTSSAKV
jgi:hypothetical protein